MPKMNNGRVVPESGNIIFVNNQDNLSSANGGITEYESNPVQYLIDVYGENSGSSGSGVYIETTKNDNVRVLKFKNIAVDESLYLFDNGNTLSIGISPDSGLPIGNNVLSVRKGGTGASSLPFNCLLVGNGINAVKAVPLPTGTDQYLTFENSNYVWKTVSSGANNTVDIKSSSDIITITITGTESNKTFTLNVDQSKIGINEINGILSTNKGGTGLSFVGANNEVLVSNGSSLEYKTITAGMITGLADVATSGSYNDLTDKPLISGGTVKSVGIVSTHEALTSTGGPVTTSGNITLSVDESKLDISKMNGVLDVSSGGTGVGTIEKDNIVIGLSENKTGAIAPPLNYESFLTYDATGYKWVTLDNVIPEFGVTYSVINADEMTSIVASRIGDTETFEVSVMPDNIPINDLDGTLTIEKGGTGLNAAGADNQFLISRNGVFMYSFVDSTMVSGLSTVATTGDYNDLRNKPVGGSVTSVGLISSNAALIVGNSPITSFGDLTIDLDSSKMKLQDIGGLLPVTKGGTGRNTLFKDRIIIGNGDQAVSSIELPDEANKFLTFENSVYTWKKIEPNKYVETIVSSSGDAITIDSYTGNDSVLGGTNITYVANFNAGLVSINGFKDILSTAKGGTGLGAIGAAGTILQSNGTGLTYGKVDTSSIVGLANVAISGDYNDLINKPAGNGSVTSVGLKSLSDAITVANTPITTSGEIIVSFDPSKVAIADISGTLSISKGGTGLTSIGSSGSFMKSDGTGIVYSNIVPSDITGLADVASSGDYNDLINKPTNTGTVTSVGVKSDHIAFTITDSPVTTYGVIDIAFDETQLYINDLDGVLDVNKGGIGVSTLAKDSIIIGFNENTTSTIDAPTFPNAFLTYDLASGYEWNTLDILAPEALMKYSFTAEDDIISISSDYDDQTDITITGFSVKPGNIGINDTGGILNVAKGGTGVATLSDNQIVVGGGSSVKFAPIPVADKFLSYDGTDYIWKDANGAEGTDTVTTIVSGHESNSVIKVTDDGPIGTYQYTLKFIPGDVHIGDFAGFLEVVKGGIGMTSVPKNAVLLGNGQQRMETAQPLSDKKSVLTHTINNEVVWEEVNDTGSNISVVGSGIISSSTENDVVTIGMNEPDDKTYTSFLTFDDTNKAVWTKLENNTRTNISSMSLAIDVDQIAGAGFVNNRLTFVPSEVDLNDFSGVLPVTKGGTGVSAMPDVSGSVLGFDGEEVRFMTLNAGAIGDLDTIATTGSFNDLKHVPEFITNISAGSTKVKVTTVDRQSSIDIDPSKIELQSLSGLLPVSKGGTGLLTVGTENQILAVKDGVLKYVTASTSMFGLANVAETGSFNDLSDVPSIVSNIRAGYGTTTRVDNTSNPSDHPKVDDMVVDIVPEDIGINEFKDIVLVAKGGTGLATLTNNSVILGNGTDAVKLATPTIDVKQKLIHDSNNVVKWVDDKEYAEKVIFDSVLEMQDSPNIGNSFVGNDTLKTLVVYNEQGEKKYDVLTESFSEKLASDEGQDIVGIKNTIGTKELFLKDIVFPKSTMGTYSEAITNKVFDIGNGVFEVQNPFDVNKFHSGKVKLSNRITEVETIGLQDVIKSVDIKKPKTIMLPSDGYKKVAFASNNGYIIASKDANKEFSTEAAIMTYGIDGAYQEKYHDFANNKISFNSSLLDINGISDITYINNPILPSPVYFARVIDDTPSNESYYAVISETSALNNGSFAAFAPSLLYNGFTSKMVNKVFDNSGLDPEIRTYVCSKNSMNSYINLSSFNFTMNDVLLSPDGSYDKALPKDTRIIDNNVLLNDKPAVEIKYDLVMFGEFPAIVYIDKTEDFAVDQNRSGDNRFANSYAIGMRVYNDNNAFQSYFRHSTIELAIFRNVPATFAPKKICVPYNISFGEFFPVFVLGSDDKLYMQVCSVEAVTSQLVEFEYQVETGESVKNLFLTRKDGGYKLSIEIETSEGMSIKTMYFTEEYILKGMHSVNKSLSSLHLFDKRIDRTTNEVVVSTLNHIGDMAVDFNTATPSASGVYSLAFDILKPVTQLNSFTVAIQCAPNSRFRMALMRSTGFYTEPQYYINSEITSVANSGFIKFTLAGFGDGSFNLETGNYVLVLYSCDASGNLVSNSNFRIGRVVNTANRAIMLNDAIIFRGTTDATITTLNGKIDLATSTIAPFEGTGYKTHNIAAISFNGIFGFSEYVVGD